MGTRKVRSPRSTQVARPSAPPTRAHAGQRPAPRHARAGTGRRHPQCHQRSADEKSGGVGSGRLPPSTGWTLQ
jgi:hypothetical protein